MAKLTVLNTILTDDGGLVSMTKSEFGNRLKMQIIAESAEFLKIIYRPIRPQHVEMRVAVNCRACDYVCPQRSDRLLCLQGLQVVR